MIRQWLDHFPFNTQSGLEYFLIFVLLPALGLWLVDCLTSIYQQRLIALRRHVPAAPGDAPEIPTAADPAARLRIGVRPQPEDAYAVAYLQHGVIDSVAPVLLRRALSHGLLVAMEKPTPKPQYQVNVDALLPDDEVLHRLRVFLKDNHGVSCSQQMARLAATKVLKDVEEKFQQQLRDADLRLDQPTRHHLGWVAWLGCLVIVSVDLIRLLHSILLGQSLYLEIGITLVLLLFSITVVIGSMNDIPNKTEYLSWLTANTDFLRKTGSNVPAPAAVSATTADSAALAVVTTILAVASAVMSDGTDYDPDL